MENIRRLGKQHNNCKTCKYAECTYVSPEFINVTDNTDRVDIVIVGEAPGSEEEKQGRPFIGKSGKVIRPIIDILSQEGISIIIVNAVNCRPPRNETPKKKEVRQCSFILGTIIQQYKPRSIIGLGSVAKDSLESFIANKDIKQSMINLAGKVIYDSKLDTFVIVAPHPAQYIRTRIPAIFEEIKLAFELILSRITDKNKWAILSDITLETVQTLTVDYSELSKKIQELTRIVKQSVLTFNIDSIDNDILKRIYDRVLQFQKTKEPTIDLRDYDIVRITPYYTTDSSVGKIRFWFRKEESLVFRDIDGYVPVFYSEEELDKPTKYIADTKLIDNLKFAFISLKNYSKIFRFTRDIVFILGQTFKIPGLYYVQERPEQTWAQLLHAISRNMGSDVRLWYIDIEVMHDDTGEFPNPNEAVWPVVVVTVYDSIRNRYTIHALEKQVTKEQIFKELHNVGTLFEKYPDIVKTENIDIHIYETETKLIEAVLEQLAKDKPDEILGWNVYFDIVYLYNRAVKKKVFGKTTLKDLIHYLATRYYSFPETIIFEPKLYYPATIFESEKASPFANILLHETLDLLSVYKWMTTSEKRSYSLDYTAKTVLGISGKLKHSGSIAYLFDNNPAHLFAYNLLDVILTVLIDKTLILSTVTNEIRHISGQTLLSEYSHLRVFPPSLYLYGFKELHKAIVGTRPPSSTGSPPLTAAFVRQPVPGIYD